MSEELNQLNELNTTSRAGLPVWGWMSTGMPRPLSVTVMVLPGLMVTVMSVQWPARASSMELSTIS